MSANANKYILLQIVSFHTNPHKARKKMPTSTKLSMISACNKARRKHWTIP